MFPTCTWLDRWSVCMLCHHCPSMQVKTLAFLEGGMQTAAHMCTPTYGVEDPQCIQYIPWNCLIESRKCPAQAFCSNSTLTITYSSRTGWVRRMREAYRVVRSTPGVTTCSFCPWSPDWRAEWSSALSPQTAKCQGFLHQNITTVAQLIRCKLLCPLSVSQRWALLHIHDKHLLPSLSPQLRQMCCYSYYCYFTTKIFFFKQNIIRNLQCISRFNLIPNSQLL